MKSRRSTDVETATNRASVRAGPLGTQPSQAVRFGVFTFDPKTRQVVADDGRVLHLTPKAFDLLGILIAQAPRVVRKSELHERMWPETFVSDATLAGLVKELRRAFHEHMPDTSFIRTAHAVGFAFSAEVAENVDTQTSRCKRWLLAGTRRLSLKAGENIIGRDPSSDVWLDAASVSRRHARIVIDDALAHIEDLGSKNGTTLGGNPVTAPRRLNDGDELHIGRVAMVYRAASWDASTESVRRPRSGKQSRD